MMREPDLHIRPLVRTDQSFLWDILHVALWDPPPAPLRPREVLDSPGVRIYAENWGRVDDIGVVGELPNVAGPIGACPRGVGWPAGGYGTRPPRIRPEGRFAPVGVIHMIRRWRGGGHAGDEVER